MATFHDKIVEVTLVYGSAPIESAQFDIPLVMASHNVSDKAVEIYTSTKAMLDAGFPESSSAYKMADLLFQGEFAPSTVYIGKREIASQVITPVIPTPVASDVYTITLSKGSVSKKFTFTSDETPTADEITAGLVGLITEDTTWNPLITVADQTGTIMVTPVEGQNVSVGVTANLTVETTNANTINEDLSKVVDETNAWFWLLADTHKDEDVLELAAYAEANDKIYWFSSQDIAVADATEGNILETVGNTGYHNTGFALWMSDADSVFPEAAVVGAIASVTPGLTTLHGKTLVGVTLEKLSTTHEVNIVSQNGNIYRKEHGVLFYRDGRMVNGDFCDYIEHALWVKARVEESLFTLFKSQSRLGSGVRFTSNGLDQVYQAIWANPINVGILNGSIVNEYLSDSESGLTVDLSPKIRIPSRANITTADITERLLDGVVVEYVYAGFIHYVKVQVNVLVNRTASAVVAV